MSKYEAQLPKLSISIVHHDGLETLSRCLHSLFTNGFSQAMEVIVVDNISTDGAVAMIKRDYPQVKVIEQSERHGFGENQNKGIDACRAEYILILNDDTVVHEGALSVLTDFLDKHADVGLVGPKLLNPDGTLQISCYKFPTPMRSLCENLLLCAALPNNALIGDYRAWPHDAVRYVDFVIGAAMLVRKTVIEKVGLFDPSFFMYAEETDWQLRMHKAGWKVALCPNAQVTHIGGHSSEGMKDRQFCEFNRSQTIYFQKHFGSAGLLAKRLTMLLGAAVRVPLWSLFLCTKKKEKAQKQVFIWQRLFKWWLGLGPNDGIRELTNEQNEAMKQAT